MDQPYQLVITIKSGHGPYLDKYTEMGLKHFMRSGDSCFKAFAAGTPFRRTVFSVVRIIALCLCGFQERQSKDFLGFSVGTYDIEVPVMDSNHICDGVKSILPIKLGLKNCFFHFFSFRDISVKGQDIFMIHKFKQSGTGFNRKFGAVFLMVGNIYFNPLTV